MLNKNTKYNTSIQKSRPQLKHGFRVKFVKQIMRKVEFDRPGERSPE